MKGMIAIEKRIIKNMVPNDVVRLKEMGNIIELMSAEHRNAKCRIRRLNANEYVEVGTGEVKAFKHILNRSEALNEVRQTLGRLRDIINTNVVDVDKCKWVTLTYADNMTDTTRLYADFKSFIRRARKSLGKFEYIVAMEPQGRGAWHAHMIMLFDDKAPFIKNDEMAELWQQGFTTTKKIESVDNVGAYLTTYLTDIDYEEYRSQALFNKQNNQEIQEKNVDGEEKRFVKGARLHLYPPKFNIYRKSRGIRMPEVKYVHEKDAQKKVSAATLTFERTYEIKSEDSDFCNILNYRQYNKKSNT